MLADNIDGRLSYQNNTGTAPAFGDYVVGLTSAAVSKIVAGSDLGGVSATGTIDVTETRGVWVSGEEIRVLSSVNFDTIGGTPQGFKVGDTITIPATTDALKRFFFTPLIPLPIPRPPLRR